MTDEFKFPDEAENKATEVEVDTKGAAPEVEIEVVDDTPEKDKGRRPLERAVEDPSDDELESYSEKVKGRISELTHARHDERRAKEAIAREKAELERMAQQLLEENKKLRGYVDVGSKHFGEQALTLAEVNVEKAKRALREATEAFDTDAIIAAQDQLMEAKMAVAEAKKFRPTALQTEVPDVQTHQRAPQADKPDDKLLRWQAKNQWFGAEGYEEVTSLALGLHQKLVTGGIDPKSDEYYERIDARLKEVFPDMFGGATRSQSSGASKRPTSVVAPASRSSGTKKIQLTTTQIALAQKFGLTPQQYAAQVAKLEAQNG